MADLKSSAQAQPTALDAPGATSSYNPFAEFELELEQERQALQPFAASQPAEPKAEEDLQSMQAPQQPLAGEEVAGEVSPEELPETAPALAPAPSESELEPAMPSAEPLVQDLNIEEESALNLWDRMRYSFASSDFEKRRFLESIPGVFEAYQRESDNKWVAKFSDGEKVIDPEGFEFGDLLDLTRFGVETVAATATEAAILTKAAALGATGVGAPAAIAMAVGAGAAGGTVGTGTGDLFQFLLGVERDPDRSAISEYSTSAVLSGVFSGLAKGISTKINNWKINRQKQDITAAATSDKVQTALDEFNDLNDDLYRAGINLKVAPRDAGEAPITTTFDEIGANTAEGTQIRKLLSMSDDYKKVQEDFVTQGKHVYDEMAAQISGGRAKSIDEYATILDEPGKIAEDFNNFVINQKNKENSLLKEFKTRVSETVRNAPQKVVALNDYIQNSLLDELGMSTFDPELLAKMSKSEFGDALGLIRPDSGLAGKYKNYLANLSEDLFNSSNKLSFDQLQLHIKRFNDLAKRTGKGQDRELFKQVSETAYRLRQTSRELMSEVITKVEGPEKAALFLKNNNDLGKTIDLFEAFEKFVHTDGIGTKAFLQDVVKSASKKTLPRLQALKEYLLSVPGGEHVLNNLAGEMLNQAVLKASKQGSKTPTFKELISALGEYDLEVRKLFMDGARFKLSDMQKALGFLERSEALAKKAVTLEQQGEFVGQVAKLFAPFWTARMHGGWNLFNMLLGKPDVAKLITQEGLEEFAKKGTLHEQKFLRWMMDKMILINKQRSTNMRTIADKSLSTRRFIESAQREAQRESALPEEYQ